MLLGWELEKGHEGLMRWGKRQAIQALQGLSATYFCSSRAEVLQNLAAIVLSRSPAAGQPASIHDAPQVETTCSDAEHIIGADSLEIRQLFRLVSRYSEDIVLGFGFKEWQLEERHLALSRQISVRTLTASGMHLKSRL